MYYIIYLIFGFIEFLVGFRFVFRLLGTNSANAFVAWVYNLSSPFITPFAGIFGQSQATPGAAAPGVFEVATLIAVVAYGVLGALLSRIAAPRSFRGNL